MTRTVNGEAHGPDEIRAAFTAAIDTAGGHAEDLTGIAGVLGEAADRYENLAMTSSTLDLLRGGATAVGAAAAAVGTAGEQLQAALADFNNRDGRVGEAVTEAGNLMQADGYTTTFDPSSPSAAAEENPMPTDATPAAPSAGRSPQQPNAAGALYIDPHDGYEARGRIVKRTKSSADIEWPNGRVEKGVKFSEPRAYGTLRWLTADELAAEEGATRWPERIRGDDGLVGLQDEAENGITITAGTAQQLAGIDPNAWANPWLEQRYALFDAEDELPRLRRALGAASRAAEQGKPYHRKVNGTDIGDIELTVTPQPGGGTPVTLTVVPYADTGAAEDRAQVKESDFGDVPDEVEDDNGRTRPATEQERAGWQADIRAEYDKWMAENPLPQPLVVHLSVPVVTRLRERLSRKDPAGSGGPA
jgi:hypothetical protein